MNWLLRFLPADTRLMVELGMKIVQALDTPEERRVALAHGIDMLRDGSVTVGEWAKFGSLLGVLTAPQVKEKSAGKA